jgi:alpha-tubulin suppressor-like RCC1 family protein
MKKALSLLAVSLIILMPRTVSAQASTTANITAGRDQLKLQTPAALAQADTFFAQALTNNSSNLEANLLKAATSLLLEQNSSQFQAQLTSVGVTINNNDIYNFLYTPPVDADGFYDPSPGVTTNNTLTYINSKMPLIDAAIANLGKFGNATTSTFAINLSSQETSLEDVRVDYGDVLMLRALLKGAKAFIALMSSYNTTAEYAKIAYIEKFFGRFGKVTPQLVLETFPDLMKFSTPDQRAAAKTLIVQANADYQLAHNFIRNRPLPSLGQYPNLFEYLNLDQADTEADQINAAVTSLNSNADLPIPDTGVTVNLSKILTSTTPLRSFVTSNSSAFEYGYPVRSSWPDPTFGGVVKTGSAILLDSLEDNFKEARVEQRLWRMAERSTRKGTIKAWGSNASSQTAVPAGLTNVVQVATGGNHSVALKADGTVAVWGSNQYGQASLPPLVATLAGSGDWGSADGTGTVASFSSPAGVAVDASGNVYVADQSNNKIRKITSSGVVTTLAGSGDWGSADGMGTAASFSYLAGVAVDASGTVYVADNNKIRKITANGTVTTISGTARALGIDQNGNIYTSSNNKILKFNPSIAGLADINQISAGENHSLALKSDGEVVGWGSNSNGQISGSEWLGDIIQVSAGGNHSLALDSEGSIEAWGDNTYEQTWSSKINNLNRVVQVAAGGTHSLALTSYGSVVAWGNNANGQTNVPNGFSQASLGEYPKGVAVDSDGNVYLADTQNNKIRKITASGTVTTLAGSGEWGSDDGPGATATFAEPMGIAVDSSGNVYVAESAYGKIRKITSDGTVSTLAYDLWGIEFIAVSGTTIYASDSWNHRIRKITSNGDVSDFVVSGITEPRALAVDVNGNVYVAVEDFKICKISFAGMVSNFAGSGFYGSADGAGSQASFGTIRGLTVDTSGNLYVADTNNHKIRKVTTAGVVSTIAGTGWSGSTDGTGAGATFMEPFSIAFHSSGLYVAENYKIRKVTTAGVVTTFAGAETYGSQDGIATMAPGNKITQIAAGGAHSLALTANGTVVAWGDNSSGQCSIPNGLSGVVQVAAGKNHSIAVKADGTIVRWGSTSSGLATIPSGITNAIQASAGGGHLLVLTANGPLGAPEIITQPLSQLLYANSNATFSVTALGANLTYQWYRNGTSIPEATSASLTRIAGVNTQGNYTVRVSNSLGNATTEPATLSLRPAAEWVWANTGPGEPVQSGDSVTFAVANVTGPGTVSYQWLKNGRALAGKTTSTLTLAPVSVGDSGRYTLAITTSAGKIVTEAQSLVVQDRGTLVYKILASGSKFNGASKSATSFSGYFVRDRFLGESHIFWLNAKTKKYSYETRMDITEKTTGPFAGSTSVLRAHQEYDGNEEEMLWISGTDSLISLNSSRQTLAPATLSGQINSTYADESTLIEMLKITLTLDKLQTLKALTTDDNDATNTTARLIQEIEAKGYQTE